MDPSTAEPVCVCMRDLAVHVNLCGSLSACVRVFVCV
jgi:hypothetical protein